MTRTALRLTASLLILFLIAALTIMPARAADRDRLQAFMEVTGFDVALDSLRFSASSAPSMLGVDADAFGADWTRLADDVFDTVKMRGLALDILEQTLADDALAHGAGFYASDLGQRLVVAENRTHMTEDETEKQQEGERIVSDLVRSGATRLQDLKRMNAAIDASGNSVRAIHEVQIRFLMAASAAGVIDLKMDADDMRAFLQSQEGELRRSLQASSLAGAAYTYQEFSDADVAAYADALEHPLMQQVYELMNAVQFEIMANRFEVLAARMAELHPGQDI